MVNRTTIRVGIIGAGSAGRRHALAYRQLGDVQVMGIVDPAVARGEAVAREVGSEQFSEATSRFWDSVDIVSVCAPHSLLAPAALQAIEHNKPLLLEKPMALSLSDADEIIAKAEQAGVQLMVGFVHRFRAEVQAARQMLDEGRIGNPTFAVEHMISGGGSQPSWIWKRSFAGGGVVLYNGVHGLDRLRWLIGSEFTEVFARARTVVHDADVEDVLLGTLTFANGVVASYVQHIAPFPLPEGWRSEFYGTDGALLIANGSLSANDMTRTVAITTQREDRFLAEVTEFVSAVASDRQPAITGGDGRAVLAAALAIYESVETGRPARIA